MTDSQPITAVPARGPVDHGVRSQIVEAATEHFSLYGYEKTTVSDLAKAIGFSKAYIYKFFDSKQAIGEVICSNCLAQMRQAVDDAVAGAESASGQLRRLFATLAEAGTRLFFQDRKLYAIAVVACEEKWPSARAYEAHMQQLILKIVRDGRESGEFERKTPLDESAHAIYLIMKPYLDPLQLQHNLDFVEVAPTQLSNLILRSLAP
ncbi:TetR/AcrR family transcriptional regulator [Cupriavidus plantarum]|uniref:TetR/AcrR family transcriptional regulator n=1 Tax=Cupriavidus plantarum TaxID=942865 RepID=UPI00339D87EE